MFIASFVFIQMKLDAYYSWMLWNGDDWVRISVKKWLLADSFHCKTNFWIIGTFVKSITFYSLILRWWYTCVDKKCKHKLTHKHAQTCRHLFEYNKHSICCSRLLLSKLVNWQEICARARAHSHGHHSTGGENANIADVIVVVALSIGLGRGEGRGRRQIVFAGLL